MTTKTIQITEEAALVWLVREGGSVGCPIHVVGPLANHLLGPVAALRPDYHPRALPPLGRSKSSADDLIREACGMIECLCPDGFEPPSHLAVLPKISAGAHVRSRSNEDQADVENAIRHIESLDVSLPVLDPRLDALIVLADLLLAARGGAELDGRDRAAVESILRTLVGLGRWNVRGGHAEGNRWPLDWQMSVADEVADLFLRYDELVAPILSRLVSGR